LPPDPTGHGSACTAVAWFLVPLVKIDRIELKAQAGAVEAIA
jgi:hypothetical protein